MAVDGDATGSGHLDRWERVRYLRPEIVLLFKARHAREKDQQGFDATVPVLDAVQRGWLREWLALI